MDLAPPPTNPAPAPTSEPGKAAAPTPRPDSPKGELPVDPFNGPK